MDRLILSDYRRSVLFNGVTSFATYKINMIKITFESKQKCLDAMYDFRKEFPKELFCFKIANDSELGLLITNYKDDLVIRVN